MLREMRPLRAYSYDNIFYDVGHVVSWPTSGAHRILPSTPVFFYSRKNVRAWLQKSQSSFLAFPNQLNTDIRFRGSCGSSFDFIGIFSQNHALRVSWRGCMN